MVFNVPVVTDYYKGKQAVVTGGAGFIGSHLVEALVVAGAQVMVIDDLSAGRLDNLDAVSDKVSVAELDVSRTDAVAPALKDAQVVFHLAGNASVPRSVDEPKYDFDCNALGTFNVLDALRNRPVESCVVASSGAVYGQPERLPITEDEPPRPISPYGATKMAAEGLCRAFYASFGVPVQIARIFNTYGPRQPRYVMYDFYRKLRDDPTRLEILGDGTQVRDFCYIADTVNALMHLGMREDSPCDAFNISSGASHSVTDVANEMFAVMGLSNVQIEFSGASWAGDAQGWEVSIEKIKTHTQYRPEHNLRSGLTRFVEWCRDNPERMA